MKEQLIERMNQGKCCICNTPLSEKSRGEVVFVRHSECGKLPMHSSHIKFGGRNAEILK